MGVIHVANLIPHKLHHLILYRVALRILCGNLHIAGMLTLLLIVLLVAAAPTALVTCKQTMYHSVGVTADRTGEMSIILERQAVMPDVVNAVFRLHHGTQGDTLNHLLLVLAAAAVHKFVKTSRYLTLSAVGFETVAEFHDELTERLQLGRVRLVVNTVRQCLGLLPFFHLADALGDTPVGKEHELLNQLIGILGLLIIAPCGFSFLVDVKLQLLTVKLHGTATKPCGTELFGNPVESNQFLGILPFVTPTAGSGSRLTGAVNDTVLFQYLLHLLVCKATVALNHRMHQPPFFHVAIGVHVEDSAVR